MFTFQDQIKSRVSHYFSVQRLIISEAFSERVCGSGGIKSCFLNVMTQRRNFPVPSSNLLATKSLAVLMRTTGLLR